MQILAILQNRKDKTMFHFHHYFILSNGIWHKKIKEKSNDPEEPEVFTEDEIYIAKLLCHFLELMQFNSHEVAQVGYGV